MPGPSEPSLVVQEPSSEVDAPRPPPHTRGGGLGAGPMPQVIPHQMPEGQGQEGEAHVSSYSWSFAKLLLCDILMLPVCHRSVRAPKNLAGHRPSLSPVILLPMREWPCDDSATKDLVG